MKSFNSQLEDIDGIDVQIDIIVHSDRNAPENKSC